MGLRLCCCLAQHCAMPGSAGDGCFCSVCFASRGQFPLFLPCVCCARQASCLPAFCSQLMCHSAPCRPCQLGRRCRWPWRICGSSCASASNHRSPLRLAAASLARGAAAGWNTRQAATFACTATDSASFPLHIVAHSTMFPISYTAFCIRFIQQCTFSVRDLLSSVPPLPTSSAQRCIFDLHWLHSVPPLPFLAHGVACWTSFTSPMLIDAPRGPCNSSQAECKVPVHM